jgi:8-oxo-dGTP pyrophosphatase MutT (NUDIX family)
VPTFYRDPAAPVTNRPRRVGAVALIARDGALLLEHRSDDRVWGLIGGLVDDDETVAEAVVREVREETGLDVLGTRLFGVFSDPGRVVQYRDDVYTLLTVVFEVDVADGEPVLSDESLELRFVRLEELRTLDLFPVHRPIVDAVLARPADVVVA